MSFLEVRNINKTFGKQLVLDDISWQIDKGELVCILGPSGCGKTTLLRIIAGLEPLDSGKVFIEDVDITYFRPARRNYGIVFQSYALYPNMTVLGNVLFGLNEKKGLSKEERLTKAKEALQMVDLSADLDKYPLQLSGGMQQRTALARAIALSPAFLLLDEPLSALDAKVRLRLRYEIRSIQRRLGITTIMVTHDQEEALTMADRIIVMNNAKVEQIGTPKEIYYHPQTHFIADFIGTMNFCEVKGRRLAIRPENIEISAKQSADNLSALVKTLEFKGPLTRIYSSLADDTEVCLDVDSEIITQHHIKENATIFLKIPEEHLIDYNQLNEK